MDSCLVPNKELWDPASMSGWPLCDLHLSHPSTGGVMPLPGWRNSLRLNSGPRCDRECLALGLSVAQRPVGTATSILLRAPAQTSSLCKAPLDFPCPCQQPDLPMTAAWQSPPDTPLMVNPASLEAWPSLLEDRVLRRNEGPVFCVHRRKLGPQSFFLSLLPTVLYSHIQQ